MKHTKEIQDRLYKAAIEILLIPTLPSGHPATIELKEAIAKAEGKS